MLKKLRVGVSIILFTLITFYFLDFAALMPDQFHALAHIQFIPAILGSSFIILTVLIILTLLFGRVYCSSICPMGVYQDIVAWLSKKTARKKKRYKYSKAKNILRWSVIVVVLIAFFAGYPVLLGLVDPYSAYGRIISNVFKPVYMAGNNVLESVFTSFGNYTFYKMEVAILSIFSFIIAILTFLGIGFFAWKYGRTFCNTICPVGTVLGFISKFSLFKVQIDDSLCNSCGSCAMKCKASCIDSKNHTVDHSRCVDCFNCLDSCSRNALKYTPYMKRAADTKIEKTADSGKRQFLATAITTAVSVPAVLAQEKIVEIITDGKVPTRQNPICPPGAKSAEHLLHRCTSCHLCISRCPSRVIKPAFMEYGIGGIMQPVMTYEKGFCNYNCTVCADVCPNQALLPLTMEEKHMTQIGRVHFVEDICVVHVEETNCGACAEHCPTQAVTMVPYEGHEGLTIPHITPDICVGCGGCEFICPVRPNRAIFVEGNIIHQKRKEFEVEKKEEVKVDDFGF
ncbi:4Fe-4S dicluster domain-containing protein [Dysgonomonas termitidis]|uniref:4Fe-4S dicluster domain-containing protein n=1 Tax=Dysgonomonas termitidis TaxID=1516126 RepID=A0ABV9KV52_9BACT